jgi:hypothetical protein
MMAKASDVKVRIDMGNVGQDIEQLLSDLGRACEVTPKMRRVLIKWYASVLRASRDGSV